MIEHFGPISGVASRGNYIATVGYDNQVILWDAETHLALARGCHDHLVNECRFFPSGKFLLSSGCDSTARLWSLPDLKLRTIFTEHTDDVTCSSIFEERGLVATACQDGVIRIFDLDGKLIKSLIGHKKCVNSVEWLQLDGGLVSSSDDNCILWWDYESGAIKHCFESKTQVDSVVVGDNSIFFGDDDGRIHCVLNDRRMTTKAHQSGIKRLMLNSTKTLLISMSYDRNLSLFDINKNTGTLDLLIRTEMPQIVWGRSCAFRGEDEIIFGTFGSSYAIFNLRSAKWNLETIAPTRGVNGIFIQNKDIFTAGDDGTVRKNGSPFSRHEGLLNFVRPFGKTLVCGGHAGRLYDCSTGEILYEHHSPLNFGSEFVSLTGDQSFVLGSYTGELVFLSRLQKLHQRCQVLRFRALQNNAIKSLVVSKGRVFAACATGDVCFYDYAEDKIERLGCHRIIANGCDILSDGTLVSVGRDKELRMWNSEIGNHIHSTPHTHSIKCVKVSACGKLIATGSYIGVVAIYDLEAKKWSLIDRPTSAGISSLEWSVPMNKFMAASFDGNVYAVG